MCEYCALNHDITYKSNRMKLERGSHNVAQQEEVSAVKQYRNTLLYTYDLNQASTLSDSYFYIIIGIGCCMAPSVEE